MILLVDDKPENLIALSRTLNSRGFQTDTAGSGESALKKALKVPYELIILDVQMPEMDGFEVAEALSGYSKTKDTPIIFLSAVNVSKEFISKGYASGGKDYLVKPFDSDILVLKMQTFIQLNRMQRSLLEEIELRKEAEAKKNEFITIASHEFNTPLTSVNGYLHLADTALDKDNLLQAKTFVDRSRKQLKKLNHLVADLLDISKIDSGTFELHLSDFNLKDFVQNAVDNVGQVYPGKTVTIHTSFSHDTAINGDEDRLEQVLQNFLSNAFKYAPDSNDVEIAIAETPQGSIRISVTDHGLGISKDKQAQLFEKFYRVEEHSKRFQGLGMGLYICAEIIKSHHGSYGVESEPGKGSTFYFSIPMATILNQ